MMWKVDDLVLRNDDGTDEVIIWGDEGPGYGRICTVHDETNNSHKFGGAKAMAELICAIMNNAREWDLILRTLGDR